MLVPEEGLMSLEEVCSVSSGVRRGRWPSFRGHLREFRESNLTGLSKATSIL